MNRFTKLSAAQASIEETERTSRQLLGLYSDTAAARRLRRPAPHGAHAMFRIMGAAL